MVKNALQAQLLKAGLVDQKKAKKLGKQSEHEQRLGQHPDADVKAQLQQAQANKLAKDQALNQEKQRQLEQKALHAAIVQMIGVHKIKDSAGDVAYQFIDDNKVKKVYVSQSVYNALVSGSLVIAKDQASYAFLAKALTDKIDAKMAGFTIRPKQNDSNPNNATTDEEDPYAAYVIPDDLMW